MALGDLLCFHCGLSLGDPPQLNELPEGGTCPVCRDRLLAELPPILHTPLTPGHALRALPDVDSEETSERFRPRLVEDDPVGSEARDPEEGRAD